MPFHASRLPQGEPVPILPLTRPPLITKCPAGSQNSLRMDHFGISSLLFYGASGLGVTPMDGLASVPRVADCVQAYAAKSHGFSGGWVTVAETVRLAFDSLRAHKLRSFLTLLGVILAVATLVSVMSVIAGLNFYVADKVANLGANVLVVDRFGIITSNDAFVKARKRPILTREDLQRYQETSQLAKAVAGYDRFPNGVLTRSGNTVMENTTVVGVTANYGEIRGLNVAQGRFLTDTDDEHRSEVAFIGADLAKKFFPNVDPIGKTIRAETHTYEVIGVGATIGSALGRSQDNYVLVPLGTYLKGWRQPNDSIMELWKSLTGNLVQVAMALVSVFLLVGGIVIMNIMLASVTERTHEIGLRRSLGARKQHILFQFLAESATLAAAGGVMGILLAAAIVLFVKRVFDFPVEMPIAAVILSLVLSTAVGLFFGIFPAMRAAKLDPIEALRSEA